MNKSTWFLAAIALLVVLGGWRLWDLDRKSDPAVLLAEAQLLAQGTGGEQGLALLKLDRAIGLCEDPELLRSLLDERATLRARRGALGLAREDLELLLVETPDDVGLRIRLAEVIGRQGDRPASEDMLEEILEANPRHGWTRTLLADSGMELADERLDQLLEDLGAWLDTAAVARLEPVLDRLTCLPAGDPLRAGLEANLLADLPDGARITTGIAIDDIARLREEQRAAYARALETSTNPRAIYGLIDLLYRSGRLEETIDFGLAVAELDAAVNHSGTLQRLAKALEDQGRPRGAAAVVQGAVARQPTWHVDFLRGWCQILYRAEAWDQLENAAVQLLRSAGSQARGRDQRNEATFFLGMSHFGQDRIGPARQALMAYVAARPTEPVEDALALSWSTLAELHVRTDNPRGRLGALTSLTKVHPTYSGEAWMLQADKHAEDPSLGMEEARALCMAIIAEPALARNLRERLDDAMARGLDSRGIDLELLRANLVEQGRWYQEGSPGLVLQLALAQQHLRSADVDGAGIAARRLLRDHPDLVPALDVLSLTQLIQGRAIERLDTLLQIVELTDGAAWAIADLEDAQRQVDGGELPAELLVRWMAADPTFTGTLELSRGLARQGKPAAALAGLANLDRNLFDDRDRLLYAELLLEIGEAATALVALDEVDDQGPQAEHAAVLRALAGAVAGRADAIERGLLLLEERLPGLEPGPELDDLAGRCDVLHDRLAEAGIGPAVLRLARLLADTPSTRDGDRLAAAAVAEVLHGDPGSAHRDLDRAEAFVADGSPLVGRLVLAQLEADAETRVDLARELRALAPDWLLPHHAALLAGLEGRRGEAEALVAEAMAAAEAEGWPDSRVQLVAAALVSLDDRPVGPAAELADDLGPDAVAPLTALAALPEEAGRRVLLLLLALDAPTWDTWGLGQLGAPIYQQLLGPFGSELTVDHARRVGDLDRADRLLAQARKRWPGFLPFWDQAEELGLARLGRLDHPALVQLRRQRRAAGLPPLGGLAPDPAELALDLSVEAAERDRLPQALSRAREARDLDPDNPAVLEHLARLEPGPVEAAEAWVALLGLEPPADEDLARTARVALAELLAADPGVLDGPVLADLALRFPDSPLLAVATAERMAAGLDTSLPGTAGAVALQDLLELLDAFLDGHADTPLDALEPGAAARWFDLLERYDPARALAFAETQRALDPRRLEAWGLVARGLEATGHRRQALEAWRTLSGMARTAETSLEAAAWLAELGGTHEEVVELLNRARRAPGAEVLLARIEYVRGRSLANVGRDFLPGAVKVFEALRDRPGIPGLDRDGLRARLGITYLHRGALGDGALAEPLLREAAAADPDPLRQDLFTALANLAPRLDALRRKALPSPEAPEAQ